MKYQLAIFDMDGTILDTLEDMAAAVNEALRQNALPQRTVSEISSFVGDGVSALIARSVPVGTKPSLTKQVNVAFCAYYVNHCKEHTGPYAGIPTLLYRLRDAGMRTAVVSNKSDETVQLLANYYFDGLFDAAVGERAGIRKKPACDAVDAILAQLHIAREKAVYIGDSEVDVETGRNAGIPCISTAWGLREKSFLETHGASCIVDSVAELSEMLFIPENHS